MLNAALRPITGLPSNLAEVAENPPGYRPIYNAILDGKLPMIRQVNGRWNYDPADLQAIAVALGLAIKAPNKRKCALALTTSAAPAKPARRARTGVIA
jgi:hypothetical protein